METFSLADNSMTILLVQDPTKTLDEQAREVLIQECIPVARKAFGNDGVTESDIRLHVMGVSTAIFVKNADDRVIAFSTTVLKADRTPPIIYLEGTAVLPEYQKYGFYGALVAMRILSGQERLAGQQDLLICTRTQSPIVFRFMSRKLGLYPRVEEPIPDDLARIAEEFALVIRNEHSDFLSKDGLVFNRDTFVMRKAYGIVDAQGEEHGFCMFGDNVPWVVDDEAVNDFIRANVNLQDGDAIILLGSYDKEKALKVLDESLNKIAPLDVPLSRRFR